MRPERPVIETDRVTRWALSAARGDLVAADAFVRASQAEVWRLLAHLVDCAAADDLTQETYLRAFRALPAFRGLASARTWLLAIARRVAADHLRSAGRRRRQVGGDEIHRQRAGAATPDVGPHLALRMLVTDLERDRREAFVLTQVVGMSYQQAAEACGVPVGTIRSRVARARGDLIAALRDAEAVAGP